MKIHYFNRQKAPWPFLHILYTSMTTVFTLINKKRLPTKLLVHQSGITQKQMGCTSQALILWSKKIPHVDT